MNRHSNTESIKKIKRLIIAVMAAFLVPIIVLSLLIEYTQTFNRTGAGSNAMSSAAIAQRVQPVAQVEVRTVQANASAQTAEAPSPATPQTPIEEAQARTALASIEKIPAQQHGQSNADIAQAGKALYEQICQACHASGLMGAPKQGDKAAWARRLKEPVETMYRYALKGKGNMPPKGGADASDAEVKAAVNYMLESVK